MLVLFETPAGYALFKLLDKGKLKDVSALPSEFATPAGAARVVKLKEFHRFADTAEALAAATAMCDDKLDKSLKRFLKDSVKDSATLAVGDVKLGNLLKKKLGISCVHDEAVLELMRGIRLQLDALVTGIDAKDREAMRLGLSHSLCRYKLKFSPDKVDTMIIQAIGLLDELDKELNTYAMRVREWYGWHFPEMGKVVVDNVQYAKVVLKMGVRPNAKNTDLSDILEEEVEQDVKEQAEVSMGTEVSADDVENIRALCDQVVEISAYRASLFEYLKNRMQAIAPNTTVMVGELVGARLIAHAGSLMTLAKHPASTVQILGAEKALFRALKTKHETPKYGLIYHASLVGQAAPKNKGKISRVLAAKTALSVRMDALGDADGVTIGLEGREKVENRLRMLEGGRVQALSGKGAKGKAQQQKYEQPAAAAKAYNDGADVADMAVDSDDKDDDDDEEEEDDGSAKKKKKKDKSAKKAKKAKKSSSKKRARENGGDDDDEDDGAEASKSEKKKSKKRRKSKGGDGSD